MGTNIQKTQIPRSSNSVAVASIPRGSFRPASVTRAAPLQIQTKLRVNTPGDIFEQEADRIAEHVMRMPEPQLQRECSCESKSRDGKYSECKKKKPESNGSLQRESNSSSGVMTAPPIVDTVLNTPGAPLPTDAQSFMQFKFGHDFSHVRIHTGQLAADSAAAVQARAYTVGSNIVFGQGEHPSRDHRLLAHELTHVLQQTTPLTSIQLSNRSDSTASHVETVPRNVSERSNCKSEHFGIAFANQPVASPSKVNRTTIALQRQLSGRDKSRRSRPRNSPRGTIPIDETDLTREEIHAVKDRIGARPTDWVGVTPERDVVTTDEDGNAEEHGKVRDLVPGSSTERRMELPSMPEWLKTTLLAAGVAAIVAACFLTGVCAFAVATAGLSAVAAAALMILLRQRGVIDSEST